jgi:hypothetical protein
MAITAGYAVALAVSAAFVETETHALVVLIVAFAAGLATGSWWALLIPAAVAAGWAAATPLYISAFDDLTTVEHLLNVTVFAAIVVLAQLAGVVLRELTAWLVARRSSPPSAA